MFRLAVGEKYQMKRTRKLCCEINCRRKTPVGRALCPKHYKQKQKEENPVRYQYDLTRSNAKRRKKPFLLTLEEFTKFCEETNYIKLKGKFGASLSIDRKDADKGYEVGNIRVVTLAHNTKKQWVDLKIALGRWVNKEEIEEWARLEEAQRKLLEENEEPPF